MLRLIPTRKCWSLVPLVLRKIWDVMLQFNIWTLDHWNHLKLTFLYWHELQKTENFREWVLSVSFKQLTISLHCWVGIVWAWMLFHWKMSQKKQMMKKWPMKKKENQKRPTFKVVFQLLLMEGGPSILKQQVRQSESSTELLSYPPRMSNQRLWQGTSSTIQKLWNHLSKCRCCMLLTVVLLMWMKFEVGKLMQKEIHLKWLKMKRTTLPLQFCLNKKHGGKTYLCLCSVWIRDQWGLLGWLSHCKGIVYMSDLTRFIVAFGITNLQLEGQWEEFFSKRNCILLTFLDWTTNLLAVDYTLLRNRQWWHLSVNLKPFEWSVARIQRKNCLWCRWISDQRQQTVGKYEWIGVF